MYVSAQNGHFEVVVELTNRGANPSVEFDNGTKKRKPVDVARENGHTTIVEHLETYARGYKWNWKSLFDAFKF